VCPHLNVATRWACLPAVDESGKLLPVPVRVGQAVDVVAQAGRPKTITGAHPCCMYRIPEWRKGCTEMSLRLASWVGFDRQQRAGRTFGNRLPPAARAGFQTHTTPVLLAVGERAELGTEKYLPVSSTLEGVVILKENPDYVEMHE